MVVVLTEAQSVLVLLVVVLPIVAWRVYRHFRPAAPIDPDSQEGDD